MAGCGALLDRPSSSTNAWLTSPPLMGTSPRQPVPRLAYGENVLGIGGVVLELVAQLGDVRIHGPAHPVGTVAPHFSQQLAAGDAGAPTTQQRAEQVVFLGRERDRFAAAEHGARRRQYFDVAKPRKRRWPRGHPPEQGLHAGQELQHAA